MEKIIKFFAYVSIVIFTVIVATFAYIGDRVYDRSEFLKKRRVF